MQARCLAVANESYNVGDNKILINSLYLIAYLIAYMRQSKFILQQVMHNIAIIAITSYQS